MTNAESQFHILVVEDEPSLLESIVDILTFEGYNVSGAKNGRLALEKIQEQIPNLIITDVMMPEMDGYQLVEQIRSNPATAATPIILLSGHVNAEFINGGLALGANMFIKKPFGLDELVHAVNQFYQKS